MIDIYIKSGILYAGKRGQKQPKYVISTILNASRFRILKALQIDKKITKPQLEILGIIYALKHVRDKFRKKNIRVFMDSVFLHHIVIIDEKTQRFKSRTKLEIARILRDILKRFPNIKFLRPIKKHYFG